MPHVGSSYTLSAVTDLPFAEGVVRAREELAREGFGILCEIDVQATLAQKLGVQRDPRRRARGGRMTFSTPTRRPDAGAIRVCTSPVPCCGFVRMASSSRELKMHTWA